MKEFLLSKGWYYAGECNCTPRMQKYHHAEKAGWEIRMNNQFYKIYFLGKHKTQSIPESFEKVYEKLFS